MDHLEALRAVYEPDRENTASQEAIDVLLDNPFPSESEEGQLTGDANDFIADFKANPTFTVNTELPAGTAHDLLMMLAKHIEQGRVSAQHGAPNTASTISAPADTTLPPSVAPPASSSTDPSASAPQQSQFNPTSLMASAGGQATMPTTPASHTFSGDFDPSNPLAGEEVRNRGDGRDDKGEDVEQLTEDPDDFITNFKANLAFTMTTDVSLAMACDLFSVLAKYTKESRDGAPPTAPNTIPTPGEEVEDRGDGKSAKDEEEGSGRKVDKKKGKNTGEDKMPNHIPFKSRASQPTASRVSQWTIKNILSNQDWQDAREDIELMVNASRSDNEAVAGQADEQIERCRKVHRATNSSPRSKEIARERAKYALELIDDLLVGLRESDPATYKEKYIDGQR
jgi:hypothetical protein